MPIAVRVYKSTAAPEGQQPDEHAQVRVTFGALDVALGALTSELLVFVPCKPVAHAGASPEGRLSARKLDQFAPVVLDFEESTEALEILFGEVGMMLCQRYGLDMMTRDVFDSHERSHEEIRARIAQHQPDVEKVEP